MNGCNDNVTFTPRGNVTLVNEYFCPESVDVVNVQAKAMLGIQRAYIRRFFI